MPICFSHAYFDGCAYDRAIQDDSQAIALDSNKAASFIQRGAAYHNKGDNAHAIQDLDQAIILDPNDATAFDRGTVYQAQHDSDHAIQDYGQAIKLAPNFAVSFYGRGVLEKQAGDNSAGDDDIAQARRIDPQIGNQRQSNPAPV